MSRRALRLAVSEPGRPAAPRPTIAVVRDAFRGPVVTRRKLQIALAFFWLLDGALQLQPVMFTRGFADHVIAPSAAGQPAFVAAPVHWAASLILVDPPLWDALFAAVQLAIGLALLSRRTARAGILASIGWAAGVWVLGEGIGGLAGGTATFLTGAPGAVFLYGVLGLAAWPRLSAEGRASLTSRRSRARDRARALLAPAPDELPARWVPALWAFLWGMFALLRSLPANDSPAALATQLRANSRPAPGWLAGAAHSLAATVSHDGLVPVVALIAVELAIGLGALWNGTPRRVAGAIGICVALAAWPLGQALGQIPTGMGTDPNSAPLVALLGAALLGRAGTRRVTEGVRAGDRPVPLRSSPEAA